MSERMLNPVEVLILTLIGLLLMFFVQGCFFARVDYETDGKRVSGTVWTIGKAYSIDPNGFKSDPQKLKVLYPPIMVETE